MPRAGPAYVHVFAHSRILRLLPDVIPHHSHSELDDDRSRCVVGASGVTFSSQPVNGVNGVSQPLHRHKDNSSKYAEDDFSRVLSMLHCETNHPQVPSLFVAGGLRKYALFLGAWIWQPSPWTHYKMDNGFQNDAYSFLCKLLNGAGQHQGEICFRIMGP